MSEDLRVEGLLPVHGFVLAGGKSSRMGVDKATLEFRGRPLVEIAVEKLREFCADVSIVGDRDDLSGLAPVVKDERVDSGPGAGVEAGLRAATQEWAMFVPVDVPLVPGELLRRWAEDTLPMTEKWVLGTVLSVGFHRQPAFCLLRKNVLKAWTAEVDAGQRKLAHLLDAVENHFKLAGTLNVRAETCAPSGHAKELEMEFWFSNLNTPEEFELAELWAKSVGAS